MAHKRKTNKNGPTIQMSLDEIQAAEEHIETLLESPLPLGRIKRICKLDPDVELMNSEALKLMTKAAELFIIELGKAANQYALNEKRKTIQQKDIDKCIKKSWTFAFLEEALDDWPKIEPRKRKLNETDNTMTDTNNEDVVEDSQEIELDDDEVEEEEEESQSNIDDVYVKDSQEVEQTETIESPTIDKFAEEF